MKTVDIPGSKSYTNRALLLASMTGLTVKITNPLTSDDTKAMIECLKTLGVNILENKDGLEVYGNLKNIPNRLYNLNAHLSGTTLRFLLSLATVIPGIKILSGEAGLNKRPIKDLVDGLSQLGAKIEYLGKKGYPPVKVLSSKLKPGTIKIKGTTSSQYISALLMIAPLAGILTIEVLGKQVSAPYIDMTIDIMDHFGVQVINHGYKKYQISPNQKYKAKKYRVEGDLSSASYFLAIAALTKSTITLDNINPASKQADMKFIKILEDMGNKITYGKNSLTIKGEGAKAVNVDMTDCPDTIQTLAVLASFAKGITKISGIASLRIKETDRVAALRKELAKMGIKTSSTNDVLTVYGGNPKPAKINTYGDHRMAMSFAVAGAKLDKMEIANPDVVNKTFPGFWQKLRSLGSIGNIVLIGMRGSGKSTIGRLLAQRLNREHLEMDEIIAKKIGLTIPEIVQKHGWQFFRDQESKVAYKISASDGKIISTGGGVVEREKNLAALKKNGVLVFLKASNKTLLERAGSDKNRPALTDKKSKQEEIVKLLKKRQILYEGAADIIIDTDKLNPERAAEKICKIVC